MLATEPKDEEQKCPKRESFKENKEVPKKDPKPHENPANLPEEFDYQT